MARQGGRRKFGRGWSESLTGRDKSPRKGGTGSGLEDLLLAQIRAVGLPEPARQAKLLPDRKFLWDFAWKDHRLAVEVQGGVFLPKSGHNTGTGITRDCEKLCLIVVEGWRCLLVTGAQVRSGAALTWIERLIGRPSGLKTHDGAGCE